MGAQNVKKVYFDELMKLRNVDISFKKLTHVLIMKLIGRGNGMALL